jgi:chemotaxis protein CheC
MDIEGLFSETQIGLLTEALNIGAGNAITALSQILLCDTDMTLPVLKCYFPPLTSDIFQVPRSSSTWVETSLVGELQGGLVIIIPDADKTNLTNMIRQAREEQRAEDVPDSSIIIETSNILAGAFLTAIHDFCGLNVFHTVPIYENSKSNDLFSSLQQPVNEAGNVLLVITNEFIVNKSNIKAYLLVILSPDNTARLIHAIENIRAV